jgi:hypothetical protein
LLEVKEQVELLVHDFEKRRRDVARLFRHASRGWRAADPLRDLPLIEFVRLLDPSVPRDTAGYKQHDSWREADALLKLKLPQY